MAESRSVHAPLIQWIILIQVIANIIPVRSFLLTSSSITVTLKKTRLHLPSSFQYKTRRPLHGGGTHHSLLADNDEDDNSGIQNVVPNRRNFLSNTAASVAASASMVINPQLSYAATAASTIGVRVPPTTKDIEWPLGKIAFSLIPLAGTSSRRVTVEECLVPDTIWTHDQLQGVVNVNVPVRQTVVKLSEKAGGGLFVYNPVAPTPQMIKMMRALEEKYGPVRHIVLGTVALEHKATFGPFAQNFPDATVWLQPGQWTFPASLPIEFLGVTQRGKRLREIPIDGQVSKKYRSPTAKQDPNPEWATDFGFETLGPIKFKAVGAFSETAFFHRKTKTLLITDVVISVTDTPPKIIQEDPRAMLFHARDSIQEVVQDTEKTRKKGWRRMVQFGLVFFPSQIDVVPFDRAISEASKINPSMKSLGVDAVPISLYPWTWHADDDARNFKALSKEGEIFCPPILTKLILDREPRITLDWVDRVCARFNFTRIIPCHLNNNVKAGPKQFRAAFDVLASDTKAGIIKNQRPLDEDLALLQKASDLLTGLGVVAASQVCDGEPARIKGRFAKK